MRVTLTTIALSALLLVQHTAEAYDRRIMLCLVNKERVTRGLLALGPNAALDRAAQQHSDDQAKFKFMGHGGSDGSDPSVRIERAGYNWTSNRENVAYGQKDEYEVMQEWMQSPGHRANILSPNVIHLGSAVAYDGDVPYYTQDFASDGTKGQFSTCPSTYTYPHSSAPATPRPSYADVGNAPAPAPNTTTTYSDYSPPAQSSYGYNTNTKPSNNNSYRSKNGSNYYSSYSSNSYSSNSYSSNSYSSNNYSSNSYSSNSYSSNNSSNDSSNDSPTYSSENFKNSYSNSKPSSSNNSNSFPTEWTCIQRNSDGNCCRWKKCTGNSESWTCRERWGDY